jgi:hypothetical protein
MLDISEKSLSDQVFKAHLLTAGLFLFGLGSAAATWWSSEAAVPAEKSIPVAAVQVEAPQPEPTQTPEMTPEVRVEGLPPMTPQTEHSVPPALENDSSSVTPSNPLAEVVSADAGQEKIVAPKTSPATKDSKPVATPEPKKAPAKKPTSALAPQVKSGPAPATQPDAKLSTSKASAIQALPDVAGASAPVAAAAKQEPVNALTPSKTTKPQQEPVATRPPAPTAPSEARGKLLDANSGRVWVQIDEKTTKVYSRGDEVPGYGVFTGSSGREVFFGDKTYVLNKE